MTNRIAMKTFVQNSKLNINLSKFVKTYFLTSYVPVSLNMSLENACILPYVVFVIEHIRNLLKVKKLCRVKSFFFVSFCRRIYFFQKALISFLILK